MALTQVTVTGSFEQFGPASPVSSAGSLQWQLTSFLFQGGVPVASRSPIPVYIVDGQMSTLPGMVAAPVLCAVDDAGTQPSGAAWVLSGLVDGQRFSQSYVISHSMAPSVDLSELTPATTTVYTDYLTMADISGLLAGLVGNADGGAAATVFLAAQKIDGGDA